MNAFRAWCGVGIMVVGFLSPADTTAQGPSDYEIAVAVLSALPDHHQAIEELGLNLWLNAVAYRLQPGGERHVTLEFAKEGVDPLLSPLPHGARLTTRDCVYERTRAECGLGPRDAVVSLEYGRPHPDGWEVGVRFLYTLNDRGDLGGVSYRATLTRDAGTWKLAKLKASGVL